MSRWIPSLLRIGIAITFALGVVLRAKAQGALPDIDTLLERVRQATEQRERVLENAWGTCDVMWQTGKPACERREEEAPFYLPADEEAICWTPPSLHEVTWYRQGKYRRDDSALLRRAWVAGARDGDSQPFCSVDLERQTGYIDHARTRLYNLINLSDRFDIDDLQRRPELDPVLLSARRLEQGRTPTISWSLIDGTPCVQVTFEPPESSAQPETIQTWEEFHFAPSMNYALVRAIVVYNAAPHPKFNVFRLTASYAPAPGANDVWLCAESSMEFRRQIPVYGESLLRFERLQACFRYTEVKSQLPEQTFTFAGLGLPAGAPIYDLRLGGVRVQEDEAGLVIHPESEYLFTGLPSPISVEIALKIVRGLRAELQEHDQDYIHSVVRNKVDAPTIHGELYQRLAFARLRRAPGDLTSLLEYAFHVQDASLVRASVEPLLKSHGYYDAEPSTAAMDLVEQALANSPEGLTPLHVEALHLSTDVRQPGSGIRPAGLPIGYDRAMALLCDCLERGTPTVQAEALRYLPGREVRTQTTFEVIKATLQQVAANESTDPAVRHMAMEKLRLIEDFKLIR